MGEGAKPKLLVVDDNAEVSNALVTFGRARGYEVHCAFRGEQAIKIATKERPNVILLDVMLPGLDGRDVMKQLKEGGLTKDAVVLFVTARDNQSDRILGLELGADDYETKPLHFGKLFDKIERLLAKKQRGEI